MFQQINNSAMLGTKRAPNYTEQEDKALCTTYVSASENPVKGTDQTGEENKYNNSENFLE